MDEPKTIHELLIRAQAPEYRLGQGVANVAYTLDGLVPELAPYVLRVRKTGPHPRNILLRGEEPLAGRLTSSTCLTPPEQLMTGMSFGPPLLEIRQDSDAFPVLLDIVRREPGKTIYEWEADFSKNVADPNHAQYRISSQVRLMEMALKQAVDGHNPFISLADHIYRLHAQGYRPELRMPKGNIMLDEAGNLTLIDQLQCKAEPAGPEILAASMRKATDTVVAALAGYSEDMRRTLSNPGVDAALKDRYQTLHSQLNGLVKEAQQTVAARYQNGEPTPSVFSKVTDTKAIALTAAPHVLVERLREMNQQAAEVKGR
jgi:hypothetical protein